MHPSYLIFTPFHHTVYLYVCSPILACLRLCSCMHTYVHNYTLCVGVCVHVLGVDPTLKGAGVAKVLKAMCQHLNTKLQVRATSVHIHQGLLSISHH